jgi:hypothetical protein
MSTLSENLRKAAKIQDEIDELEAKRDKLINQLGKPAKVDGRRGPKPGRKRRKMSRAGRAAVSAAQKARWAKIKAAKK